jgi:hypothetical protein
LLSSTEPPGCWIKTNRPAIPRLNRKYLDVAGIRVNLIPVRARPLPTASKLGRAKPPVFTRNDFEDPDKLITIEPILCDLGDPCFPGG